MTKQHPSLEGIVPCFESGRKYLDWIQNWREWAGSVLADYEAYFLELGSAVRHYGYERPIPEKKMCKALERVHHFINRQEWHFAKTMPQIPHWYCLQKECDDKEEFLWFARYIQEHSKPGQFYGRTYHYCYLGKYKYWMMDERPEDCDLINRDETIL